MQFDFRFTEARHGLRNAVSSRRINSSRRVNREQRWSLSEARVLIEDFRQQDNTRRPHSRLRSPSPARFATQLTPSLAPVGLRPPSAGDGQTQSTTSTSDDRPDQHSEWLEKVSPVSEVKSGIT